MFMTVDLKNIKMLSQDSFSGISETSDDTMYFVEAVVVTETYRSNTEWRRIWSDGWCEQGGQTSSVPHNETVTIPLGRSYSNSNYTINITGIGNYSATNSSNPVVTSREINSFAITNGSSTEQSFMWETKGYIS